MVGYLIVILSLNNLKHNIIGWGAGLAEGITIGVYLNNILLGIGVGAAIGAKLAAEDVPVVGFVGEGSLYYADSGLWTASHHNIPLLYVITKTGAYGMVANAFERAGGQMSDSGEYGGVVLDDINPLKIANSYGIDGERLDNEDKVKETIKRALDIVQNENRPYLLDVRMPLGLPSKGKAMKQFLMKERKN